MSGGFIAFKYEEIQQKAKELEEYFTKEYEFACENDYEQRSIDILEDFLKMCSRIDVSNCNIEEFCKQLRHFAQHRDTPISLGEYVILSSGDRCSDEYIYMIDILISVLKDYKSITTW